MKRLQSVKDDRIRCGRNGKTLGQFVINEVNKERRWQECDIFVVGVGGKDEIGTSRERQGRLNVSPERGLVADQSLPNPAAIEPVDDLVSGVV